MTTEGTSDLARVWRAEWGRLLALLVRRTRRLDLAEDALADAFETAARRWPLEGTPDNPAAWLLTTARRRTLDRLRAEAVAARTQPLLAVQEEHRMSDDDRSQDDLLRLVLLAAHPALSQESGAALTLRLVLGLGTADIARLFLVSEPTMAARLTRARKKVVTAGMPLAIPDDTILPERLETVARVAYLAFTAGYAPGSGDEVVRAGLGGEAIRLVHLVRRTGRLPEQNATLRALLALMLLQHSRRAARVAPDGSLVLLPEQDRTQWRHEEIAAGLGLLEKLTGDVGVTLSSALAAEFTLQALIAREHAVAARAEDTDWVVIADYYRQLEQLTGSPVVRLNRAVAVAESGDLVAALALLDGLDERLGRSHRLPAVRSELLARAGRVTDAIAQLDLAIERCAHRPERRRLQSRRDGLAPA